MRYLYLDESGDLGFDFITKKHSKFFTVTVLVVQGQANNRALINSIKSTLKRKLRKKKLLKESSFELKGCKISLEVKKYFFSKICKLEFNLYALTLNKKRVYQNLMAKKERLYNYVARLVLDKIPFEEASVKVQLIVDKSKSKPEIADFNSYIVRNIQARLDPKVPFYVSHALSHENLGLQAVDVFSWGIFKKYEKSDLTWFDIFKEKVAFDQVYLP